MVEQMARDLLCSIEDLIKDENNRIGIDLNKYVTGAIGLPTLTDILAELAKPGRDPRKQFKAFSFAPGLAKISDLEPGMKIPGIVTNVTAFGAFVDVGVHQDGLVHISQLADRFVKDPSEIVKVHQQVTVTVMEVDLERNRIGLSMKENPEQSRSENKKPQKAAVRKPAKSGGPKKREPAPFNNPFAQAFKKKK